MKADVGSKADRRAFQKTAWSYATTLTQSHIYSHSKDKTVEKDKYLFFPQGSHDWVAPKDTVI